MTHTHTTSGYINKRKDKRCSRPGARQKLERERRRDSPEACSRGGGSLETANLGLPGVKKGEI